VTQVVPQHLVNKALILINKKLGEPGAIEHNEHGLTVFQNQLGCHTDILNLLYASPAYTLAQVRGVGEKRLWSARMGIWSYIVLIPSKRLIGRGKVNKPCHAQIALRFPEDRNPPNEVHGKSWHVVSVGMRD
jgi:hypothetical protein